MENTFVTFLTAYSALIQALATVVLVVLTTYYVKQARKTALELEWTRKADFLPILSVRLETRDPRTIDVYLGNIGCGLARRPEVSLPFEASKAAGESVAPAQENVLVTFENVGIAEIVELPEAERVLRVSYKDIFGRDIVSEVMLAPDEADDGSPLKETIRLADWRVVLPE